MGRLFLAAAAALSIAAAPDQPRTPAATDPRLIRELLERGDFASAEQLARASRDSADATDLLVEALVDGGRGGSEEALTIAQGAVAARSGTPAAQPSLLALSLRNLGSVRVARGEFAIALPLYDRAISLLRGPPPADDDILATALDGSATALIRLDRLDDALTRVQESEQLREHANAADSLARARTLQVKALLYRYKGNSGLALPSLEQALTIERRLSPRHPDVAASLQVLGDIRFINGDARGAEQAWVDGLEIATERLQPQHPLIALLLHRLYSAAKAKGDMVEARRFIERAAAAGTSSSVAPCDREAPGILSDLAVTYRYEGDFAAAGRLLNQALAINLRCLGPNHSLTATVIMNQGFVAMAMGDTSAAERLYQRAVTIWSTVLGPNHPYVARGLDSLAEAFAATQPVRARSLYERALAIRRRSLGGAHPEVAWTLTNIAAVSVASGDLKSASDRLDEAVSIYLRGGLPQEPDHLARALELRGTIEMRSNQFEKARATYAEALATRQMMFGVDNPLTAESTAHVATASFSLGDASSAMQSALDAERTSRDHLRFTIRYLPERQAMAYAGARARGLDVALSVAAAINSLNPESGLDAVIRSRGVILDELGARAAATAVAADPQLASLNTSLIASRQRFAALLLRSQQGEDPVPRAMLEEARQQKEDAERALAERSATAREEAARAQIGLDDVRGSLPVGSVLVSFVRYDRTIVTTRPTGRTLTTTPSYIALVARADSTGIRVVPIGTAAAIDKLVDTWHAEAGGRSLAAGVPNADALRTYRAAGTALRARIWDPLADSLKDATRIFIVPDGALNLVSFASLPVGTRYLLETAPAIHYLSTERDLVRTETAAGKGLLALGGPAFDGRAGAAAVQRGGPCAAVGTLHFDDLPGSRAEIQDIVGIWGRQDALTLTGTAATKNALTKAIAGRKVIHLATHGFFLGGTCEPASTPAPAVVTARTRGIGGVVGQAAAPVDNPLMLAGLALAGVNTLAPRNQQNGILNAEEIAGLNLQGTEWAVLSACDTGLGQITAGEGVFGLRRALQIAGVHTIVMSLWSVEDQSTRAWMRALYRARLSDHLDTPDSVRAAGLRLLADRRARGESTHPFYWAAFVAAGDWR